MSALLVPIVRENAEAYFLAQLGISRSSDDADRLLKACKQLYTLNQAGSGEEWEEAPRLLLRGLIEKVANKYNLYCIFETTKNQAPAKFAHKLSSVDTLKLIGADVWRWL